MSFFSRFRFMKGKRIICKRCEVISNFFLRGRKEVWNGQLPACYYEMEHARQANWQPMNPI
jgi:hypothetical protein